MKERMSILIIAIVSISLVTIGTTYAYFSANAINKDVKETGVKTGKLSVKIDDKSLMSSDISPIYDTDYEMLAFHKDFEVINDGTLNSCTGIYLKINKMSDSLKSKYFKYKIMTNDNYYEGDFEKSSEKEDMLLIDKVFIEHDSVKFFDLYIWISYQDDVDQMNMLGTSIDASLVVKGLDAKEEALCK